REVFEDDDELGLPTREPDFHATRVELRADLRRGLPDEVEEPDVERRRERFAQAAGGLGRRLVAEPCGGGEVGLDRLDGGVALHREITMTSPMTSVKQ